MLYVAMTFWLLVVMLVAWGVHAMWSSLLRPRVLNSILLPGTLVAAIGHVVGCLVTGATIEKTTLIKDDDSGEPETTEEPRPRLPVIGPIVIAMLPFVACTLALGIILNMYGSDIVSRMGESTLAMTVPTTMAGVWQMLRDAITLVEQAVNATTAQGLKQSSTWLFIYVVICLTVRMAPLPGALRGAVGAILVLGILSALLGQMFPSIQQGLRQSWGVLSFAVAVLLFLLLASLAIRGVMGLMKLVLSTSEA